MFIKFGARTYFQVESLNIPLDQRLSRDVKTFVRLIEQLQYWTK